jgi:recombination protein RecT
MSEQTQTVAKQEETMSVRFMNKVISEFSGGVGEIALTDFQKRLAQNYFIAIDAALSSAEDKRKKKNRNQDPLPVTWANVNMAQLARSVVAAARVGLDPAQPNHVAMMPFKNNALNKYDIVFIDGYRGIELKGKKYGLDIPDHVIVELVYSTDKFKSIKKDRNNQYESYEFEITNEFDRGDIIGGFYYHVYSDKPEKNRLVVMSLKDILKRKPRYASVEFWGGEKDVWENGKKVGTEHSDGWFEKMCYKTIYRAAYRDITIDSQKIDDDYMRLKELEHSYAELQADREIADNANQVPIDVTPINVVDDPEDPPPVEPPKNDPDGEQGPGF